MKECVKEDTEYLFTDWGCFIAQLRNHMNPEVLWAIPTTHLNKYKKDFRNVGYYVAYEA